VSAEHQPDRRHPYDADTARRIQYDYINYEHGGRTNPTYSGDGGPFDFTGLVRIMSTGTWPHILGIGEADRWDFNGYEGAYEAAAALRAAGGPPYVPHVGGLPREWGPFAPGILYDPTAIQVHRWYDHRLPDFSGRNRNLLIASLPGRTDIFRVVLTHGDFHDGDARLADAKTLDRFADPDIPCVILGDWNATLSGPQDIHDFNAPGVHRLDRLAHKIQWNHGPAQTGPYESDTRALDYLCGYWHEGTENQPGHRAGGIGFYDIADLADDHTPTQIPRPNGRQPRIIDHALVNKPFKHAYVPGSYQVHQPIDPDKPDSDHLRISFTIKM
jgi:hypothetical protein